MKKNFEPFFSYSHIILLTHVLQRNSDWGYTYLYNLGKFSTRRNLVSYFAPESVRQYKVKRKQSVINQPLTAADNH